MSRLSRETGISRATLYRAFSKDGDPNLSIVLKVATALGIKVKIVVATVPGNGGSSGIYTPRQKAAKRVSPSDERRLWADFCLS
jgi:transcriptional regulator with XRE-family HTH domain